MFRQMSYLAPLLLTSLATLSLPAQPLAAQEEMNEHEQRFQKMLKGAELIGSFTVIKDGEESEPKKDTYEIHDLQKMPNGFWLFTFKYGDKPPIPMALPVKWADDTPMISLTKVAIPGLGTFSCRVLFHEDQYAGTWRHGEVIGNMWGVIKRPKEKAE